MMVDVVNMLFLIIMVLLRVDYLFDIEILVFGIGDKFVLDVWGKFKFGKDNEYIVLFWYFGLFVVMYNKDIFKDVGFDFEILLKMMIEYFDFVKKIIVVGK